MTEPDNITTDASDPVPPPGFEEAWVSSYDAQSTIGFVRPTKSPDVLVRYFQQNLGDHIENVLEVGQQVWFKLAGDNVQRSSNRRWEVGSEIRIPWDDEGDDDPLDGS